MAQAHLWGSKMLAPTPTDNVLRNQVLLDQSAALQGQTRQNALNALSQGVGNFMDAPLRREMQQNALVQSDAQAQITKFKSIREAASIVAPLLAQVEQSPDPASAYAQAVRVARASGVEIAPEFETYDPDDFAMMKSIYTMPPEEMTEFEGLLQGLPEDQRRQAVLTKLGLVPSADARLRGQVGDKVPSGYRRTADGNLAFIPGGPADPANKSQGWSITTGPNGETTVTQGRPVGRAGQNQLDIKEIDARDQLARLERIQASSVDNPNVADMNTLSGNLKRMGLEWQDFIASDSLTDEQAQYLVDVTTARGDILENVNFTIKEITGAAMTEPEAKRIGATLPSIKDSPRMFQAKLDRALDRVRGSIARYNMWRNNGMDGRPEDLGTLSDIQSQMDARLNDLLQAVESGDMTEEEANGMFASEFGL